MTDNIVDTVKSTIQRFTFEVDSHPVRARAEPLAVPYSYGEYVRYDDVIGLLKDLTRAREI